MEYLKILQIKYKTDILVYIDLNMLIEKAIRLN